MLINDRADRTARTRSARRSVPRDSRPAAGCRVEAVESRILFHLHVETPINDAALSVNAPPTTIDLSTRIFDELGPTVRMNYSTGQVMDVGLYDRATPITVANFLNYVNSGRYDGTVIHRTEPIPTPFVIQGGGYTTAGVHITQDAPIQNEFSSHRPNVLGTLSMAKGQSANSATSEWFVNLANNTSLDQTTNSGGFTTFGEVLNDGMTVADAIDALPRVNATGVNGAWNHFPVTQATNPPLPTLSTTNSQDVGTPTTPTTAQMVVVTTASVLAQRHAVTYTVQSTDTALVTPTISGNNLTLTYGAGLRGSATVTVTATEEGTGAIVQDSFDITIGSAMNVNAGQGANAQSVVFTDADGTVATVHVAGGSAVVSVGGDSLTQSTAGRTVTVNGTSLSLTNLVVTGTNPNVTIKTVGGDGRVTLGAFSAAGPVRGLSGRGVVLRGTATLGNAIGRLDVAGTQGATITIQRSGSAGFVEPSINIGNAVDTDIDSQAPLKLKLGTFGGTDADADTITTPAIRNMQVNGDFTGALDVSGNGQVTGSPAVGNVRITGGLTGAWTVGSLKTLRAGTILNAVIRSNGGIGSIAAGSITGSTIFAGLADTAAAGALPADKSAFLTPAAIGSVTLKGKTPPQFTNSVIAATTLGRVNLGAVEINNNGTAFGLAADTIGSLLATPTGGAPIRGLRLADPSQSIDQTDFEVRVL